MKIVIYEDELYPFYHFDYDIEWNMGNPIIQVNREDVDRYSRIQKEWEEMQNELATLHRKGEE